MKKNERDTNGTPRQGSRSSRTRILNAPSHWRHISPRRMPGSECVFSVSREGRPGSNPGSAKSTIWCSDSTRSVEPLLEPSLLNAAPSHLTLHCSLLCRLTSIPQRVFFVHLKFFGLGVADQPVPKSATTKKAHN